MRDDEAQRAQHLALTLHRATALVDRVADTYLRPAHGIGISAFAALVTIDALQPARQSEIARGLDISRAAVTQQLGGLTARGLIAIEPDAADSRANRVRLTPAGGRLLAAAWEGLARQDDGVEDGVDLDALQSALDTLIANATRYLDGVEATR
ncbi:MarR family winged helix-turn-helix transcriptional regulator [Microbacterium sp. UBA3394]|uniref:MarR family winged helix-turn-helix transcriptional regulator n=1 Tax=Microbacterium sp. UBA3394 TaxID=1946945 RepID=UPI000C6B9E1D|nr:MarR family winged helix-turn-helix transcriptional regulator [Microbacterium sp. UBA3394]MAM53280.1 MarR family transcriptional regulator [Microbacterium sp.]|tara:strand:+ start:6033 stop:6491 length:459 start_codon:yes stop_codon:yes gene_type:complete